MVRGLVKTYLTKLDPENLLELTNQSIVSYQCGNIRCVSCKIKNCPHNLEWRGALWIQSYYFFSSYFCGYSSVIQYILWVVFLIRTLCVRFLNNLKLLVLVFYNSLFFIFLRSDFSDNLTLCFSLMFFCISYYSYFFRSIFFSNKFDWKYLIWMTVLFVGECLKPLFCSQESV